MTKKWTLYQVDAYDVIQNEISLSSNPSATTPQLVIQPNTLNYDLYDLYGVYRLTYNVTINYTDSNILNLNIVKYSSMNFYLKINLTGIIVLGLQDGVQSKSYGYAQSFVFAPRTFSFYLNIDVNETLTYLYYCRTVDNGVANAYPQVSLQDVDLASQTVFGQNDCFNSTSRFSINPTTNELTVNANSLPYLANRTYEFKIETTYLSIKYNQLISVSIANISTLPVIALGCQLAAACVRRNQMLRFNPDKQIIIDVTCLSGCTASTYFTYKVEVNSNQTLITYAGPLSFQITTGDSIVISPSAFQTYTNETFWRVTVIANETGQVESSSLTLVKNKLPYGGQCTVDKTIGTAMSTLFTIMCFNWADDDGSIVRYEYFGN